jgi:hypothetical protein
MSRHKPSHNHIHCSHYQKLLRIARSQCELGNPSPHHYSLLPTATSNISRNHHHQISLDVHDMEANTEVGSSPNGGTSHHAKVCVSSQFFVKDPRINRNCEKMRKCFQHPFGNKVNFTPTVSQPFPVTLFNSRHPHT